MNSKQNLSIIKLILMGGAVFSMHFGAACMLYPVTWGKESGQDVLIAMVGIFISAIVLPFMAYVALSKGNDTFLGLTRRISPKLAPLLCALTVITMGPLYVIPRMSAASWDALMQITGFEFSSMIPIVLYSIVFYALTYWFIAGRADTVDKISKYLFPILVIIVIAVIGKGIIAPISGEWIPRTYAQSPIVYGLLEGNQGDTPAALMFGLIVIQGLKREGLEGKALNRNLLLVGAVGLGMLCLGHFGHMLVGANTGGTIDLTLSALYSEVVLELWGPVGGVIFNVALVFAALTTAVGLTGSTAEYFEEALEGKYSYKKIAIVCCILSGVVAIMGLNNLVVYVAPILWFCHPICIVVSFYYILSKNPANLRALNAGRWALAAGTLAGLLDMIASYNLLTIKSQAFIDFYSMVPLGPQHFAWVPFAIIAAIIGYLVYRPKQEAPVSEEA